MVFILGSFAVAYEKGSVGVNIRVDPSPRVGMTFHISSRFAIRPYVGFSMEKTTSNIRVEVGLPPFFNGERQDDTWRTNFGMGFLYYVLSNENLSVFTGLNFGYSLQNTESTFSWNKEKVKNTGDILSVGALLGLQVSVLRNLSIFGEIGLGYTYGDFSHDNRTETSIKNKRWGLSNSGVGLIFYF